MSFSDDQVPRLDRKARAHVKRICTGSRSSFYWGMRLLPRKRRDGMFAIYAYCRLIDDIADNPGATADSKLRRLADWRQSVAALFGRARPRPEDPDEMPLLLALEWAIATFDLPEEPLQDLISGMEMDIQGEMLAPDWKTLDLYCHRAAGVVGLLSIRVFGDTSPQAHEFALTLAGAVQLTNILRDLEEDAALGRLYLPAEELAAQGLPTTPIEAVLAHARLNMVCRAVAAVAQKKFLDADRLLENCDRRALRPARIMMDIYRHLLDHTVAGDWQGGQQVAGLSRWKKLRIVASANLPP